MRRLALTIGCVALVVGAVVVGPHLWLQTSSGHRMVQHLLTRILNARVAGNVTVGALGGDVWTVRCRRRRESVTAKRPCCWLVGRGIAFSRTEGARAEP